MPFGDGYGSSMHPTGLGEIGMAAILAAAILILATVGILTIFTR